VTLPAPASTLILTLDQARELEDVLTRAAGDLVHGRLSPQLLHDLHRNAARLELGLRHAQRDHHDSKEAHQ
jgi:hypothetical protein